VRRGKDIPFAFDRVFDQFATQYEVFQHTTQALVAEVLNGYNCACFAYGAMGAGKTFTMVGTDKAPGVMVLTLQELFSTMKANEEEKKYTVKISYLEVYNENIHDLLVPQPKPLQLLDSGGDMTVLGLTQHEPQSAEEVLLLLQEGNTRRAQNFTHANAESSRSHAVLQVVVEQRDRTANVTTGVRTAKFSLIDLAGSERASRTKNQGKQLVEGANINRSLLALGNCINALGAGYTEGKYVPYRDSKLTRLLKDSLGGNCKTVMISNVSPSTLSYEDTFNTLQYANRAKNIKTKVRANEINLVVHVSEYKDIIADLRKEVEEWKSKCSKYEAQLEADGRARQAAIDLEFEAQVSSLSSQQRALRAAQPGDHRLDLGDAHHNLALGEVPIPQEVDEDGSSTPRGESVGRNAILRQNTALSRPAASHAPSSVSKLGQQANQSSLPLLSRTVSMGLQTPRNMKTEKRLLNLSSSVDDVVTDRRNVQEHLQDVNATLLELMAKQSQLQEQIRLARVSAPCSPAVLMEKYASEGSELTDALAGEESEDMLLMTPAKSSSAKVVRPPRSALKRELDGVLRKLDEQHATRTTLLQRLERNAEHSKRLQVEMSQITPHAEDASWYRQLKLELVINVLEISNFNRAMQEAQLAHALATSSEKMGRAVALVEHFRSTLRDYGYSETDDLVEKCDLLAISSEEPLEVAHLPSPFARSPSVLTPPVASDSDPSFDVPSTPSRFVMSSHGPTDKNTGSIPTGSTAVTTTTTNISSPRSAKTRIPFSIRQADVPRVSAVNKGEVKNIVVRTPANAAPVRVSTHVRNSSQPPSKKTAAPSSRIPRQSMAPTVASAASVSASSVVQAPSSVSRIPKSSVTTSVVSGSAGISVSGAKRTAIGLPQRIAPKTGASGSSRPFQSNSDAKRITPTKISHRYRNDPAVLKALATFRPAFEPKQEKSTPPNTSRVSASAMGSGPQRAPVKTATPTQQISLPSTKADPKTLASDGISSVDVKGAENTVQPIANSTATGTPRGGAGAEPNPLAALLGFSSVAAAPLDASMSTSALHKPIYSQPPTIVASAASQQLSPSATVSASPLLLSLPRHLTTTPDTPASPMRV
jgi:kinesin family protein 18/19